jgi:hypothetical protein
MFYELHQRDAAGHQRALHHLHGVTRREPVNFKRGRPGQLGLVRTQVTGRHGRQTVVKGGLGQQGVA